MRKPVEEAEESAEEEEGKRLGVSEHGRMKIQCFVLRCALRGWCMCRRGGANPYPYGHILLRSRRLCLSIQPRSES